MTRIVETVHVGEPAGEVWEHIGGFASVGEWHPMLANVTSDGDDVGSVRRAEGQDGSISIERLTGRSDEPPLFYRYRIESSPMPFRDYDGELRVEDDGDGTSTVVWSAEFEPTLDDFETIDSIRTFLKTGLSSVVDQHRTVVK